MQQKINDFNLILTKIVIAHKWFYNLCASYSYPEGRKNYGLIYLLTGELEYRFTDGRYLHAKAGDLILLKPTDAYTVTCPALCEHYTINFQILPNSIEGEIAKRILLSPTTAILQETNTMVAQIDLFKQICNIWEKKDLGYQIQALLLTYKLLYFFIKNQIPYTHSEFYPQLEPAIKLLEANWNQELSLKLLANSCNLSIPHFRHLFTKAFKTSPMNYRNSLRLLYAKDYLSVGGYSITDVATKCGFEDINYFSRFFKKYTGISPSKYTPD